MSKILIDFDYILDIQNAYFWGLIYVLWIYYACLYHPIGVYCGYILVHSETIDRYLPIPFWFESYTWDFIVSMQVKLGDQVQLKFVLCLCINSLLYFIIYWGNIYNLCICASICFTILVNLSKVCKPVTYTELQFRPFLLD